MAFFGRGRNATAIFLTHINGSNTSLEWFIPVSKAVCNVD